jgi:hypothetical protein
MIQCSALNLKCYCKMIVFKIFVIVLVLSKLFTLELNLLE